MKLDRIIHYKDDDTEAVLCIYSTRAEYIYLREDDPSYGSNAYLMNDLLNKIVDDDYTKVIKDEAEIAKYLLKYSGGEFYGRCLFVDDPDFFVDDPEGRIKYEKSKEQEEFNSYLEKWFREARNSI